MADTGSYQQTNIDQQIQSPQTLIVIGALMALAVVAVLGLENNGWRVFGGALIGALAGLALYHTSFGFTAAWRRIVTQRRGQGLRAQFLLISLVCLISFPLLQYGSDIGLPTGGFVFPFGVGAAVGAFIFGIGMQLGGGCGSGTLFTVGGGSSRMVITLAFFVLGSVIATAHLPFWNSLPRLPAFSLVRGFGVVPALMITILPLIAFAIFSMFIEKKQWGELEKPRKTTGFLQGQWGYVLGALILALVCVLTFIVLRRPWGVTSGFALWGAKFFYAVGIPVETWPYWKWQVAAIERSVFADSTSVMNFGIVLGALIAAGLAGKFNPVKRINLRDAGTAIVGGLMLGYGARLAYGCNIGAYLGGITSGSMHGWLWLVFAFAGSMVGTRVRHLIGMDPAPVTAK
ncbi:YeeE/YedE family protein [Pseudovibrio brasiliensis]|nr:YeeE/YedE family protein [Pseudovibrio brasiliensis]